MYRKITGDVPSMCFFCVCYLGFRYISLIIWNCSRLSNVNNLDMTTGSSRTSLAAVFIGWREFSVECGV